VYGGASRNRLRANRFIGNGYADQGKNYNFGMGIFTNANIIEENIASGNTNGLVLGASVHGNVVRRNLIVSNPPVQISVDHVSTSGVDIKNLSPAGANFFSANICVTSVNAPCPAITSHLVFP
jgi:parallel beta-helix repeat protein